MHIVGLLTFVAYNDIYVLKVLKRSIDGKLCRHVHKKLQRNRNKDGDKCRSLWQGEWNHFLTFILWRIMPYFERNCCCMHCRHWSTLHQIWMSWIDNDNVYQGLKTIYGDDNIHSSSCVVGEKVKNLSLYMSSIFWCYNCNDISKCIMGYNVLTLAWAT